MTYAPANPAALSKQIQMLWGALCAGVVVLYATMGWLTVTEPEPAFADAAQPAFFGVAVLSLAGLGLALWVMRGLEDGTEHTPDQVQQRAIVALAGLEATAFAAAIAAFLTGDLLPLAFGVPMLAFAAVFWPDEARVAHWLGRSGEPPDGP